MNALPAWPGPAPENITAWTLVRAGHVIGRRFHKALGEIGLTPTQFGVLLQLDLHPGMSNGQIARSVLVTPQSMSELLTSLAGLGLIQRELPDLRGQRIAARLTPAGQQALSQCAAAVGAVEDSLALTAEQTAALNRLLRQIISAPAAP